MKKIYFREKVLTAGAIAAALMIGATAHAASSRTEVGVLSCQVEGGFGLIVGSSKSMDCTFAPSASGPMESYSGRITRLGVDIGKTEQTVIKWAVFAPTRTPADGALAGRYGGVSGEVTVVGGVGANALIGGSRNTIVLQPLSAQAQTGLSIAAGIAGLSLSAQ